MNKGIKTPQFRDFLEDLCLVQERQQLLETPGIKQQLELVLARALSVWGFGFRV